MRRRVSLEAKGGVEAVKAHAARSAHLGRLGHAKYGKFFWEWIGCVHRRSHFARTSTITFVDYTYTESLTGPIYQTALLNV